MARKNKLGFGFNLALSIYLIIVGILLFVIAIAFYIMTIMMPLLVFFGLAFNFCSFCFVVVGIINIVFVVINKTGNYSTIYIRIVPLLFHVSIMLCYLIFLLVFLAMGVPIIDLFTSINVIPFNLGFYVIPSAIVSIILISLTFKKKRSKTTKNILTLLSALLSLFPIAILIYFFYMLVVFPVVLGAFALLILGFIVYLIIDIFIPKQSPPIKEIDVSTEEIKEESIN